MNYPFHFPTTPVVFFLFWHPWVPQVRFSCTVTYTDSKLCYARPVWRRPSRQSVALFFAGPPRLRRRDSIHGSYLSLPPSLVSTHSGPGLFALSAESTLRLPYVVTFPNLILRSSCFSSRFPCCYPWSPGAHITPHDIPLPNSLSAPEWVTTVCQKRDHLYCC